MTPNQPSSVGEPQAPCPRCGTPGIPIIWGLPGADLAEAARRGEVILGGCLVTGDDADHECPACRHQWRANPPEPWPPDNESRER